MIIIYVLGSFPDNGKGLVASTPQIRGLYNLLDGGVFHHAFQEGAAAAPAAGVFSLSPSRMTG